MLFDESKNIKGVFNIASVFQIFQKLPGLKAE
jgi:hypothetical protein